MAIEHVALECKSSNDALQIVYEMRERGFKQGTDFDFSWHKPIFDNFSYEEQSKGYCDFIFYNENLATWFRLMWL